MNERLQRVEEKIAYLERHVIEQDRAMLEMAENIAGLRRELALLRERGEPATGGAAGGEGAPASERPPHY